MLCGRPRSRAVPASIACGSLGILWKCLAVGRAAAAARSTDSGGHGTTSCAEHEQGGLGDKGTEAQGTVMPRATADIYNARGLSPTHDNTSASSFIH